MQQWDKCIVILVKTNKVIGITYEDCMFKNVFMLSLSWMDLGYKEHINIVCDRNGMFMLMVTAREILLCVAQKAIQKYNARPYSHHKMSIIEENIKWNRNDAQQAIIDIVKF